MNTNKTKTKLTLDEWLDKVDEIVKAHKRFYYSNNFLGTPKFDNGIDSLFEKGMSPQEALDAWKNYKGENEKNV